MKYSIFRLCICGMFVLSFCGCINSQNEKRLKTLPKTEKVDVRSIVEQMRKDRNPRREIEGLGLFFQENQRAKKMEHFISIRVPNWSLTPRQEVK